MYKHKKFELSFNFDWFVAFFFFYITFMMCYTACVNYAQHSKFVGCYKTVLIPTHITIVKLKNRVNRYALIVQKLVTSEPTVTNVSKYTLFADFVFFF